MVISSNSAKQTDNVQKVHFSWSFILTLLSIIISLFAMYFTGITYLTAYRPYVGVVRFETGVQKDKNGKPILFTYSAILKNTGVIPAQVHLIANNSQIIKDDKAIQIPKDSPLMGSIIIMPNGESPIQTWLTETSTGISPSISPSEILSGKTLLNGEIKISYEVIGAHWWNKSHHYDVYYKFMSYYVPPGFSMETGDAD